MRKCSYSALWLLFGLAVGAALASTAANASIGALPADTDSVQVWIKYGIGAMITCSMIVAFGLGWASGKSLVGAVT